MRNIQHERPQLIRVMLLHPPHSPVERQLELFLNDPARGFPVRLIQATDSPERCRSMIRELFPDVILLADLENNPQWRSNILQISKDINIDFQSVATVILTDAADMEDYFAQAMSAGARSVVKVEQLGDGLLSTLGGEVERAILQAFEFIRRKSSDLSDLASPDIKTVAVMSGKGGVGKSTIATALAGEIARRQPEDRVVLVDFDVQFGAVAPMLGLKPSNTLATLAPHAADVGGSTDIADFLTVASMSEGINLHVLAAPPAPMDLSVLHPEIASQILSTLRRHFDVVVVDLPTQMTDASLAAFQLCELLLLVCEPEMLSVRSCRQMVELLTKDPTVGRPAAQTKVVLNKVRAKSLIKPSDVVELFPDSVIGQLPYEPEFVNEHISRGQLIGTLSKRNAFVKELSRLYSRLNVGFGGPKRQPEVSSARKEMRGKAKPIKRSKPKSQPKSQRTGILARLPI